MGRTGKQFGPIAAQPKEQPSPFLKWAGGKGQLIRQMRQWVPPDFRTYLEPFLGGGAVFFSLLPERAILSDLNPELMNVYWTVQNHPEGLMSALGQHEPRKKEEDYYYAVRDSTEFEDLDLIAQAARTIFLNKTCYNGLYRVNKEGRFNVPFGRYNNPRLYQRKNILGCNRLLNGMLLMAADYRRTLEYAREGDFVYLDPPYQPVSETANFTSYTKNAFSESDQKDLSILYQELDGRGCQVMMSNSSTGLVHDLYGGYRIEKLRATRPISSKVESRGEIEELLIMNYGVGNAPASEGREVE